MRPECRETSADVWMRPPSEMRGFLKRWYRAMEAVAGKTAVAVA